MLGYPLRSFSLRAEGVSLCTVCATGAVTPHPPDGGSLGTHGGGQLRPMSLKWWRGPRWFPHISEGSMGFQRALELYGDRSEHPSSCTRHICLFFLLEASPWHQCGHRVDQNPIDPPGHPRMHELFSTWQEDTEGRTSPPRR